MHRTLSAAALTALLAAPALAQNCFFVPDADATQGTCNAYPMNVSSTRYQTLVDATDLGNSVRILKELAFAPCGSGTMTASRILIRFAHFQGATLSTNFATNLGSNPTTMLQATNWQWSYTQNTWSPLGLTGTFTYIPTLGNLVIDIEFEGASGGTSCHRDTRQRVYANNWTGQPPATGSSSSAAAKLQLSNGLPCLIAAFTQYGTGCGNGPLTVSGTGLPQVGANVSVQMSRGAASSPGAYFLGGQKLAIPLSAGGFTNCTLYTDPLVLAGTVFDASGMAPALPISIPNDNNLLGLLLFFSGLDLDQSANPVGIAIANGLEMLVGR